MTDEEVLAELEDLIERLGERHRSVRGVLYALCGAICEGTMTGFGFHVRTWLESRKRALDARWN